MLKTIVKPKTMQSPLGDKWINTHTTEHNSAMKKEYTINTDNTINETLTYFA